MTKPTQAEIDAAKRHFYNAYLNTGCDEDDAFSHTEFMWQQCGQSVEALYFEATRYEDM